MRARVYVILSVLFLILLSQSVFARSSQTEGAARRAQDYVLGAEDLGGALTMLSEGTYAAWKSSVAWKEVRFAEDGLCDSYWRLLRETGSGYGPLSLREHVLLYDSAEAAEAALGAARQDFMNNPMYLQEGGLRTPVQPYTRVTTAYGDETWAVAWVDIYDVQGYAALVRYGDLLLSLTVSARDLTPEAVQGYHRLLEQRILRSQLGLAPLS